MDREVPAVSFVLPHSPPACVIPDPKHRRISFSTEGPGRLIGVGNGDPSGVAPELADSIPAYSGRAQAIIGATPTIDVVLR